MMLPLTAAMPLPGGVHPAGAAFANISKGLMILMTATGDPLSWQARFRSFVAIFSAVGLRDDAINAALGGALAKMPFPRLRRFRLDPHKPDATCWCHSARGCWSVG